MLLSVANFAAQPDSPIRACHRLTAVLASAVLELIGVGARAALKVAFSCFFCFVKWAF